MTVLGPTGCGKSSTVAAVCQYLSARDFFLHGVLYVKIRNRKTTLSKLLVRIEAAIREQAASAQAQAIRASGCGVNSNEFSQMLPSLPPQGGDGEEFDGENRRNWVIQALKSRSALLVIDQADYLSNPHQTNHNLRSSFGGRPSVDNELDLKAVNEHTNSLDDDHDIDGDGEGDSECDEDLRSFLDDLFDAARSIKILLASSADRPLLGDGGSGGVVEAIVPLGGLSLRDSVRLFCRLSPKLRTAREREQCLSFLVPPEPATSSNMTRNPLRSHRLLDALGGGMPSRIVHVALDPSSLDVLLGIARNTPALIERKEKPLPTPSQVTAAPLAVATIEVPTATAITVTSATTTATTTPAELVSSVGASDSTVRIGAIGEGGAAASGGGSAVTSVNALHANEGDELTRQDNVDLEDVPH